MKTAFNFIKQIWTASIRRQLMLGIILVHAVLMSIFVYDLVERQRKFLHTQSIEQAKSLSKTLAANSSSWVLANDVIGLEETIEALINYPALRYSMVLSPKGRVLGHTQLDKVGLYVNDLISAKLLTSNKEQIVLVNNKLSIDIASPILSNGIFIGWARVNLSQKDNAAGLEIITRNGLLYTLLAIIVGALFAFYMGKGITRGLQHIVDVAEGIKGGNLKLRANLTRHDELGKLAEDFNIMLDTINKSKRDLQAIMDNSPAVIYVKDINGRFTFINKQFEKLFHFKREDIIGKSLHDVFSKDIADEMKRNDKDVLKTGQALESEELAPQDDGMHTYTSIKFPLYDDERHVYGICGISSDITSRIKMAKEKAFLESQLLHTQKMQAIGQLTGGVAHDFNNLLAVILGYTELSQEMYAKDNEGLNDNLKEIYTAGTRGRDLIQQMMIYSRKDQGDGAELLSMNLEEVVKETVSLLQATFPASINIETSTQENIPNIKSNSSLISQVLMNLCINAKDGMGKEGNLLITLNVESFNNQLCSSCHEIFSDTYVAINIKDDGKGIAEDILDRIFEPFFTSKKVGEGTGMGLSVVHGVVHKLGGHIVVTSTVGEGTNFKVLLPISDEKIETKNNEKLNDNTQYDFSDLTVMVVDDEPAIAGFLERSLKLCKAKVEVFTSSQQALAHFEGEPEKVDIVITDQTMPDLTGVALSEKLLALRSDIAIILCTGYSTEITEESAFKLGIKSFMHKPVKMEKLYSIINELK